MSDIIGYSSYRKEIDGLRAIAVLAVIFYHAELTFFGYEVLSGGFLGVDIFFVISGFLITGILWDKNASLIKFYKGRFDRIYPSLLLVLVATSILSYLWLMPKELIAYAKSLNGALGFYSNYIFMGEEAYIAEASKFKPLLHTWSLSVEWQFYLIYPMVLLVLKKFFPINFLLFFSLLVLVSFSYYIYGIYFEKKYAFFSIFSRAWELMFGGLFYFLSKKYKLKESTISVFGFFIIVFILFYFNDKSSYQALITLMVVLCVGLIIMDFNEKTFVIKILESKYFVRLGLLSYVMYLLHQPIFVFYRIRYGEIGIYEFIVLFFVIYILSFFISRWFEGPLRFSNKKIKYFLLMLLFLPMIAFSYFVSVNSGFTYRYSDKVRSILENFQQFEYRRLEHGVGTDYFGKEVSLCINRDPVSACVIGGDSEEAGLIIAGDSFAGVFEYSIFEILKNEGLMILTYQQCPLLLDPIWFGNVPHCWEINEKRWEILSRIQPTQILVGTNFNQFFRGYYAGADSHIAIKKPINVELVYESFRKVVVRLVELGFHPVILLQTPKPYFDVSREMFRRIQQNNISFSNEYGAKSTVRIDHKVKSLLGDIDGVTFIDVNSKLCDLNGCFVFNDNGALFNRGDHLSYFGVQIIIPDILEAID